MAENGELADRQETIWSRLFPLRLDNAYTGSRIASWLLGLVIAVRVFLKRDGVDRHYRRLQAEFAMSPPFPRAHYRIPLVNTNPRFYNISPPRPSSLVGERGAE